MSDRNERAAQEDTETFGHSGSVWAPRAIAGGMTGVAVLALALGIVAVVLAATGTTPLLATVLAFLGLVTGMRLFLPRLTVAEKLLIPVGMVLSVAALLVLLIRLGQ